MVTKKSNEKINLSDRLTEEDIIRKTTVYVGNYLAGVLGNYMGWSLKGPIADVSSKFLNTTFGTKSSIANPVGGIIYGALDVARNAVPKIKGTLPVLIAEGTGALYYSASSLADLFGWLNGDWGSLVQLPFDLLMATETGRNFIQDHSIYKSKKERGDYLEQRL